jgi:hypothetical protein
MNELIPQCRSHLESRGYLLSGEWDLLVPGDRRSTAALWIQRLLLHCHSGSAADSSGSGSLQTHRGDTDCLLNEAQFVMLARYAKALGAVNTRTVVFTKIPYPYSHVSTISFCTRRNPSKLLQLTSPFLVCVRT